MSEGEGEGEGESEGEAPEGAIDVDVPVEAFLPDALVPALNDDTLDIDDLRPVVTVSNGLTVDVTRITDEEWTGSFNVTTAGVFQVTITWVEDFQGGDLQLARRTVDFAVGEDERVVQAGGTGYNVDFDDDDDGPSNLDERRDGTNPRVSNAEDSGEVFNDSSANETNAGIAGLAASIGADTGPTTVTEDGQTTGISETPAVTADVIVPRISESDAPVIDGLNVTENGRNRLTGEWAQAVQSDISGATLAIDHLMIDIDAETTGNLPYRRWAAMHDGSYLYIVVLVDDVGQRFRDSGESLYDDDSLELYIDGDNSKSSSYDNDDFHRLFPLRAPGDYRNSKAAVNNGDMPGPNSSTASLPIEFATGPGIGPDGLRRANYEQDVYELRIPLQPAGISSDSPFGFELQVNDDDDGLTRDAKWGWKHPARNSVDVDNTYLNPSLMGTLMLE